MAMIKISEAQAQRLLEARTKDRYQRKNIKKAVFSEVRREHGIPYSTKFRIAIENPDNPMYLVVRNKRTDQPLTNGLPDPVVTTAASAPAAHVATPVPAAPAAAVASAVSKVAAKKAAAPAKKAAPAAKAPAKKAAPAVKKAPAKKAAPVKAPAAKKAAAPAKTPAKKAVSVVAGFPKDVRITVDGKRIRLGTAKTQAEYDKMVKDGKRKHGA